MNNFSWKQYVFVFIITAAIFAVAFWASGFVSNRKIEQLQNMQQQISLDILSTETRYALLGSTACKYTVHNEEFEQGLNQELNELARRVKYLESELEEGNATVLNVKKQYNLLQIKDYLLRRDMNERCGDQVVSLLYFHEKDCKECQKQTLILDELHEKYPEVRTYWLDRDLGTPAMDTLLTVFDVIEAPTIVIGSEKIQDFANLEELETRLPQWLVEKKQAELEAELQAEEEAQQKETADDESSAVLEE